VRNVGAVGGYFWSLMSLEPLGASAGAQSIGSQERPGCLDQDKARSTWQMLRGQVV
jgi:hypothetical protein